MVNANAKQVIREQASRLHSESHVGFSSPVVHELVLFAEQREFSIFFPRLKCCLFSTMLFPLHPLMQLDLIWQAETRHSKCKYIFTSFAAEKKHIQRKLLFFCNFCASALVSLCFAFSKPAQ